MKNVFLFSFLLFGTLLSAQSRRDLTGEYFHLTGKVYEIDMVEGTEKAAISTQIVVYQNKELYVAFYTEKNGLYEFYLPIGYDYDIWYGGSSFVNKKVHIDTKMVPKSKKPSKLDLDMGLFRPIEGYEFPILNEPFVQVSWDEELAAMVPDLDYTEDRLTQLEKQFKKIRKELAKKAEQAEAKRS